jgi:hypothetical protein
MRRRNALGTHLESCAFPGVCNSLSERSVHIVFDLAPVIADIIASHCPGTRARHDFVRACIGEDWDDARAMVEGMLAEPWRLRGHQETRLRQFLELV